MYSAAVMQFLAGFLPDFKNFLANREERNNIPAATTPIQPRAARSRSVLLEAVGGPPPLPSTVRRLGLIRSLVDQNMNKINKK